jgi:hypothetical protein
MVAERFLEVYGSIGLLSGVVQVLYLGVAFWLGSRLVQRARHSRELPELLLGVHLLLSLGVGYLLLSSGIALAELSDDPPRDVIAPLLASGYAATILGLMATLAFTHRVFRPGQRRSIFFVALAATIMWAGFWAYGSSGGFAEGTFQGAPAWTLLGGMLVTNLWVAAEPLRYHLQLRRRIPLGLADPLVADRFLLWGCGSLARVFMILLGPAGAFGLAHLDGAARDAVTPLTLALASALGLFISVTFWLTFSPTDGYRRWVARRYAHPVS